MFSYAATAAFMTQVREAKGLTRGQLAAVIGYKNITKGARRITDLESGRVFDEDLIRRIQAALGINQMFLELAYLCDWNRRRQVWEEWINEPVAQYLVLGIGLWEYRTVPLPHRFLDSRHAEKYAARRAKEERRCLWIVSSRRHVAWFDDRGQFQGRVIAKPPNLGEPFVRFGGANFPWMEPDPKFPLSPASFVIADRFGKRDAATGRPLG